MKKKRKMRSGARSIYLLIALMIVTAIFTGAILGWMIWYGISGGVSKSKETEEAHTEENTDVSISEEETEAVSLPDVSEISGANQQMMIIPYGDKTVIHEAKMGFTMDIPNEWSDRLVSRYEEELDGTTLVFYEKENMLASSEEENEGVLFSIKEYHTMTAVLPEGDNVQILREPDQEENTTAVVALLPEEPDYVEQLQQPYEEMLDKASQVLSTFTWDEKGEDIRFDLTEGITVMLPYFWADHFEIGRAENVEIAEGIIGTIYDVYESENHKTNGNGLLMRLFVHGENVDVSSIAGYQGEIAEVPEMNGAAGMTVSWFSMEGQYDVSNIELTYQYQYLYSSIPWIMENNISVMEEETTQEETTTLEETAPETTEVVTVPPTTRAPETQPPTTAAPETQPPTTAAPETQPPTTAAPETQPPTSQPPQTQPSTTADQPQPTSQGIIE